MTIKVRSLHALRDEMRAVARGKMAAPGDAATPTYESADAVQISAENLLRLLTPDNRALLQMIDSEHPASIDALADKVGRAPANVSRTLGKFVDLGMVRLVGGQGLTKRPELTVRHVTIKLDICHQADQITVQ